MNMSKMKLVISAIGLLFIIQAAVIGEMLDFWGEETRLFGVGNEKNDISWNLDKRASSGYRSSDFSTDNTDKKIGDFSISYIPAKGKKSERVGFVSDLWGRHWDLSGQTSMRMYIKIEPALAAAAILPGCFIDNNGLKADFTITIANGWTLCEVQTNKCAPAANFNFAAVKLCQFDISRLEFSRIGFDGIVFEKKNAAGSEIIGVTDKSLEQRNAEEAASRSKRIEKALIEASTLNSGPVLAQYFARLYLGRDIEETNRLIMIELEKSETLKDSWDLYLSPALCRMYYLFSSKSDIYPGRLKPDTEKKLLEVLWHLTKEKNDINWARQSTWWMDGSENHDLNAKVCNLVTSRIFMNEPDYKDRLYPDLGYGGGYHYGKEGYYWHGAGDRSGGGRAELSDGKQYNAQQHYQAWLAFIKEYFSERIKRGFFLERASRTYNKHTMNFVDLAYCHSGDEELKKIVGGFMDIFYTDWALETITAIRGGSKTRFHYVVQYPDPMEDMVQFYIGGPGNGSCFWYWSLINGYQMPDLIKKLVLDRESLGSYVYMSRCIGEEQNIWPRPLGTERTMICDTFSRMVNYSYVTPDYVLSCRMTHPAAVHSHLSITGQWHGMIFAGSQAARIVPFSTKREADDTAEIRKKYDMECVFRSVQAQNVMITQQSHRWFQVVPDWYPSMDFADKTIGVYLGKAWEQLIEKEGWIFVNKGNAYAAVRPVMWDEQFERQKKMGGTSSQAYFNGYEDDPTVKLLPDSYVWIDAGTAIELKDKYTPVIIQAGRKDTHGSFDGFIADILDNPIRLYKTVVPGFHVLVYNPTPKPEDEIVFNAATTEMPTIGGKYIDYEFPYTFKSPYIEAAYNSGIVKITKDGQSLNYDFSK